MSPIKKIKNKIGQQLFLAKHDLLKSFYSINRTQLKGNRILVYHGIDHLDNRKYNTRFISQKRLAHHILEFRKYFNLVSVESILSNQVDPKAFNIALTFDDGYKNNLSLALPVLEEHNTPATFCITGISETAHGILWTDYLDIVARNFKNNLRINDVSYIAKKAFLWNRAEYITASGTCLKTVAKQSGQEFIFNLVQELKRHVTVEQFAPFSTYWEQLDAEDIFSLSEHELITIAGHGYYHSSLASLTHSTACQEMFDCKRYLEHVTGKSIDVFAYPDGSYNLDLIDYGKSIGFDHHMVMNVHQHSHQTNANIIPRLTINPYISTHNQVRAIINGGYYGSV